MTIYCSVFSALLAFLVLANTTSADTEACLPTNERKNGMNINFYEYTLGDITTYREPAYMGYEFSDTEKLGSVSGQTGLSIYYRSPCDNTPVCWDLLRRDEDPCSEYDVVPMKRDTDDCDSSAAYWGSDLFGFYTTPTNVTVEMTGYFLAPENGSYTFYFDTADDSAILSIGGDKAFQCCEQEQSPATSTDFTINAISGNTDSSLEGSVYMYAGYYYPMKVVFSNADFSASLPISMSLPNGTMVFDDFDGYVYSFENNPAQADCTITDPARHTVKPMVRTRTQSWTGTYTTTQVQTSIYTGLNGLTTEETIFEIQTPTDTTSSMSTQTYSSTGITTAANISSIASRSSQAVVASSTTIPTSSDLTQSETVSSSASSSTSTSTSSAFSTSSVIITSTISSDSTSTSSALSTIPTSSNTTYSSQSDLVSSSTTSSILITSSSTTSETQSKTQATTISFDSSISGTMSSTEDKVTSSPMSSDSSTISFTTSSTLPQITSSFISFVHSITPIYPSNQTAITSGSPSTTSEASTLSKSSESSKATVISVSSNLRSSTLDADAHTASTSSSSLAATGTQSFHSSATPTDSNTRSLTTSNIFVDSSSTLSTYLTTGSASSSSHTNIRSFSTISSKGQEQTLSSSHTLTSSRSIKFSESYMSSVITFTGSNTENFKSQTSSISSSASHSENYRVSTTSISFGSLKSSSSLSVPSFTTYTTSGTSNQNETPSFTASTKSSINRSFASFSQLPVTTSDKITSPPHHVRTTISSVTPVATEKKERTTLVTITSCEFDICSETVSPAIVSTSTATVSGAATEYTTWCPISTLTPSEQTTLITVTYCKSGVCSKTTSPAIVSTATTIVNDAVTVYTTWCSLTTYNEGDAAGFTTKVSYSSTNPRVSKMKTTTHGKEEYSTSGSDTHPSPSASIIIHSNGISSASKTTDAGVLGATYLNTVYEQPRSTYTSNVLGSSTAYLEMSSYVGIGNGLLTNNAVSILIASVLLAII